MTLADIRRSVRPGREYMVTSHADPPFSGTVHVTVTQVFATRFYVAHPLGEAKVYWPPASRVSRDENGVIRLLAHDGTPDLTLVPLEARTAPA